MVPESVNENPLLLRACRTTALAKLDEGRPMRSVGQGKGVVFAEVPVSFGLTSGLNPIICVRLWFLYSGFLCVSAVKGFIFFKANHMNRFVFLTDTHYWTNAPADFSAPKMLTCGAEIHEAMVSAINAIDPDFIFHGGDFLCGGSSFDLPTEVFEQSIRDVRSYVDRFAAPFYGIPGNHDCDAQTWSFESFTEAFDTPEVLAVDQVSDKLRIARANVFIGDTKQWGAGEWTDQHDELLREANRDAMADSVPLLLCLHSWILPDGPVKEGEEGRGCVRGAARLLQTVTDCASICVVFTGHRHLNRITTIRDFLIVDTSCLIGYPFGFREISLSDDGWFSTTFHRLTVPQASEAYGQRDDAGEDAHWEGQPHHQNRDILIPRLRNLLS